MIGAHPIPNCELAVAACSVVTIVALLGTPRRQRSPQMLAAVAASWVIALLLIASDTLLALCLLVPGALLTLRIAFTGRGDGQRGRTALSFVIVASAGTLALAAVLRVTTSESGLAPELLLLFGLLCRMGVFPMHGWLPELAEDTPLPATILAGPTPLPPLLLIAALQKLSPDALAQLREPLIALGTIGALYGAVVALAQTHLRRMLAYLAVGQSGAILAAAAAGAPESSAGVVLAALAYGLPYSGLMSLATAIEARTGSARIDRLHGLGTPMPHLAAGFLVLGFAFVGFPGSLGFIAEDVMLHGILATHPFTGAAILLATAINAITIFRCFQRVFLGPSPVQEGLIELPDLLPRERAVVVLLALLVTASGVFPAPLVTFVHHSVAAVPAAHQGFPP